VKYIHASTAALSPHLAMLAERTLNIMLSGLLRANEGTPLSTRVAVHSVSRPSPIAPSGA
jgi:hypothetical protein